ncbi:MAG: hypothetical protein IMF08_12880 [Proteobacteria bacterium]|nr:hypothetical protein [Pseudomonadota bacterium]
MNGRFKRMLEPGEHILVRSTDGKLTWYLAGWVLLLCAAAGVRSVLGAEVMDSRFWNVTLIFLAFAPLIPAAAWAGTRWKWVFTDRRVLKRYGMFSSDIGEMRNEAIDEVRLGDRKLAIQGAGYRWEFIFDRNFHRVDILYGLFGARMGDSGQPVKPLGEMLEPGETVLWRYSPLITDLLPWLVLFSAPAALIAMLIWPESRDFLYFSPMLLLTYAIFFAEVFAFWRRRGWQTAITDRRLLRRRAETPFRCDAVPLDSVTEAYWESKGWELVIVSPGRRDTIVCLPRTARRILDALERSDRGEALA